MSEAKRILYINGGLMNRGGIESYMMNYYRHFDRNCLQIDFVVHGEGIGAYDDEIKSLGGHIYHVPVKSQHPFQYADSLKRIFKSGRYKLVHSHVDAMSCWTLKIAKECGVPVRIAHSHNTQHLTESRIKFALNEYARKNITKYATHCFACSKAAGEWLFGNHDFTVIPNAIEIKKYAFQKQRREYLRREYGLSDDTYVVGHVGRFDRQKNHDFLLDMFHDFHAQQPNSKLVLIGDGENRVRIEEKTRKYSLEKAVLFLGNRSDVYDLYNMMDVFVLPSLFEGLGIVLIEAQTNGLRCIVSQYVPTEADLTRRVRYLPIDSTKPWCDALQAAQRDALHRNLPGVVAKAGYDITEAAIKLQNWYLSVLDKVN